MKEMAEGTPCRDMAKAGEESCHFGKKGNAAGARNRYSNLFLSSVVVRPTKER